MLRPDLIKFIQESVEVLATEIAFESMDEGEYQTALQFAADEIQFGLVLMPVVDDDDFDQADGIFVWDDEHVFIGMEDDDLPF